MMMMMMLLLLLLLVGVVSTGRISIEPPPMHHTNEKVAVCQRLYERMMRGCIDERGCMTERMRGCVDERVYDVRVQCKRNDNCMSV